MYPSSTLNTQLPEWYTLERKAEKSIKKLSTIKELDYYIKHPDEQLRRLAILRINELKLKDSFTILKEVMDEPVETEANKELAAWTLKYISVKLDKDLFISHRLLTRYTGNESYSDLYNVNVDNNLPSPKLNFSAMPEEYRIKLKSSDVLNAQISLPDMEFDFKGWLSVSMKSTLTGMQSTLIEFFAHFGTNMTTAIKGLPSLPGKVIRKRPQTVRTRRTSKASSDALIGVTEIAPSSPLQAAAAATITAPSAPLQAAAAATITAPSAPLQAPASATTTAPSAPQQAAGAGSAMPHKPEVYSTRAIPHDAGLQSFRIIPFKEEKRKDNTGYYQNRKRNPAGLKKILFEILYILLFPVRVLIKLFKGIYRYKFTILATAAAVYCLLVFTTTGRVLSIKLLGIDLRSYHLIAVENIKSTAKIAWAEIQDLTGTASAIVTKASEQATKPSDTAADSHKVYTVTAQNGLNVRTAPKSSASKAGNILENGVQVTYLDQSSKDSSGRVWYYIMTPEGVNGWVYSGGLK